jgi:hypothetical protein
MTAGPPGAAPQARIPGRRMFFALWPEPPLQAAMAAAGGAVARNRNLGGRDIPPERLHLTLLFLGDVAPRVTARSAGARRAVGQLRARDAQLGRDLDEALVVHPRFGTSIVPRQRFVPQ